MDMRTLKYVLGLGLFMLLFTGCDDIIQAKRDAYEEAIGN